MMDDTLKNVVFGLFSLFVVHGSLEKRVNHDAARQVMDSFNHTGVVHTRVESRGIFGVFGNKLYSVDIFGDGLISENLPFYATPRAGWKGSIRHLRLHLTNLTLKGLPVERFDADIPDVTYDIGQATYKDWLVIRGAGRGAGSVQIGASGLETFVLRKYKKLMTEVHVTILEEGVTISGQLNLFGKPTPFTATGNLVTRDNRYLDLAEPKIEMNGKPVSSMLSSSILKQINPVLDIEADLGLGGYFTLERLKYGKGFMIASGQAGVPIRKVDKIANPKPDDPINPVSKKDPIE